MAEQEPFLRAEAVSKQYTGQQALGVHKTNLTIEPGKITAIIGESGSGKSTLLKLLYGLISPDDGKVYFKGERIWGPEEKLIPGHDAMKMVTQHTDDLNLYARVWDNVASLLPNTNLKAKQEKSAQALQQLNMLHLAEKKIAELSGGEKQRVAIARALVTRPEVLLLDEPFNQVDASFREGLQQDIRTIVQQTGLTVIMVSHDPAEVLSMADRLIVLKSGRIIETGEPQAIYRKPIQLYTARLLSNCNVLSAEEAVRIDLKAQKKQVAIYPECIDIVHSFTTKKWKVSRVLFKGFYEQLSIEHESGLNLRLFNYALGKYKEGDTFNIKVRQHLDF
jgi:ABC-type Fe3+/spermidine/putrescine transport system ATPase subunit